MILRRTWWMSVLFVLVAVLQANVGHADKAKTSANTSCDEILQAADAPKAMLVVRAATCFIEQGQNARAAQLLQKQLEQMDKDGTRGGKGAFENKLQLAAAKIAVFDVHTQAGAEISVDGQVIGKYPEANPLFLEPGAHVITARLGKAQGISSVEATAASQEQLELKLVTKEIEREIVPDFGPAAEADKPKPASRWTALRVSISIAGSVVGLGGLGLGIGSAVSSTSSEEERAGVVASFPQGSQQCSATPDLPDCNRVASLVKQRDEASSVAIAGFVVGGVGLAAAITALVWPAKTNMANKNDTSAMVTFVPLPRGSVMTVLGTF